MICLILVVLPILSALLAWRLKAQRRFLRFLLAGCATAHLVLSFFLGCGPGFDDPLTLCRWLAADGISRSFLLVTSLLFFCVSLHSLFWLPAEEQALETREHPDGVLPLNIFVACLLGFEGTMTLVILAQNFGLLWVAVEATTLVSAPLILFHRSQRSLEAMWKYLLICSVGIGLALFGTMLLAASLPSGIPDFSFETVSAFNEGMKPQWFLAAFVFVLAGYGTKMGLAPFHTWLPDAHSESPGTVSALLSGALLNCSFLGIIRFYDAAPDQLRSFCGTLLTALGLVSLATAAFFTIRQNDYKRMLAYSSIEHMGLLAIFCGAHLLNTGMLHLIGHSLIKMSLFLLAGNFLLACGTRRTDLLGGLRRKMPKNGIFFLGGILMICGVPPSPLFYTELTLVSKLPPVLGAVVLLFLFLIFAGMTYTALHLVHGPEGKVKPDTGLAAEAEKLSLFPGVVLAFALAIGAFLISTLIWEL